MGKGPRLLGLAGLKHHAQLAKAGTSGRVSGSEARIMTRGAQVADTRGRD